MNWGHPQAFWLLLLTAVLLAAYLRRRRTPAVTVPSLLLWQAYGRPADQRPIGVVLRNLLSLLAQVALLCLLVLALADPDPPRRSREHLVLIVDGSATMQTHSVGQGTRLAEALQRAQSLVSSVPDDALLTIMRASAFPQILLKASADKGAARAALSAIQADDIDTDLQEAVRLGESLHVEGWRTRIACISDFAGVASPRVNRPDVSLSLEQVGRDIPNVGIVGLALAEDRSGLDVGIGQSGLTGRRVSVGLRVEPLGQGAAALAAREQAPPGRTTQPRGLERSTSVDLLQPLTTVRLPGDLPAGTAFSVHLDLLDGLPLDNAACGVWPDAPSLRVRLVTEANPFLEEALRAEPTARLHVVPPGRWDPRSPVEVTVLDGMDPSRLRQVRGRYVLFADGVAGPAAASSPVTATYWSATHPALRNVDPGLWQVRRSAGAALNGARVLVSAQGAPLLYEWPGTSRQSGAAAEPTPETKAIVFNFRLADSDLALRPAFPVVLWDAISYLIGVDRPAQSLAHPTGSPLKFPLHGQAGPPGIVDPQGRRHPMLKQGAEWVWLDTNRQGLYTIGPPDHPRAVAVNWMSLRSSMPYTPLPETASRPLEAAASRWPACLRLPWQRLLGLAVAAAIVEWILFQRRLLDLRRG